LILFVNLFWEFWQISYPFNMVPYKTPEEALKEVQIAKHLWLQAAHAENKPIPPPKYRPVIYQTAAA